MVEAVARNGRTESEILARSGIPVAMGDTTFWMRPLSMDAADEWEVRIKDLIAAMFGKLAMAGNGIDGVLGLYRQSIDAQLDALYAYDELGTEEAKDRVLPERSLLRKFGSRDDVDEAIRKLVKHEFPLLKGMDVVAKWVPAEVREIVTRELIRLLPETGPRPETGQEPAPDPSTNDSSTNTPRSATPKRSGRR